jgi:branched-chain amino acid transport system permease protein
MGMVLWAPNGLAGIIMLHEPVWKAGLMKRLWPAYVLAAWPALVIFLGLMLLIEINYHLSLSIDPTAPLKLFRISFSAQSPLPWGMAIGLIIVGFLFFRRAARRVNRSWQAVTQEMKQGAS